MIPHFIIYTKIQLSLQIFKQAYFLDIVNLNISIQFNQIVVYQIDIFHVILIQLELLVVTHLQKVKKNPLMQPIHVVH